MLYIEYRHFELTEKKKHWSASGRTPRCPDRTAPRRTSVIGTPQRHMRACVQGPRQATVREERAPRPRRCATSRRRGTCPPDANSVPGWFRPVGEASGGQSGRPDCPPGSRPPEMLGSCPGGCGWRGSCSCCASWRAAPGRRPERSPSSAEDVARDSGPRRRTRVQGQVKFPRPDPSSARIRGRPSVRHPGRPSWWHSGWIGVRSVLSASPRVCVTGVGIRQAGGPHVTPAET